ncbi:MAG TPA: hypothetical protein VFJ95_02455, partial [Gammaproteobacteria bacterium]|nr:hypothetical protein [Gammaproteobacteria bacterium]
MQLRPDAQKLLADAWHEMIRSKSTGGFGRRIRRGWKYGEGKEIVGKTAAGVAVGAVFVGVSIATAGAATPVVIAIAAGAFAAGQVPGAAASIIKNRKGLHGITNTANWVSNMASADPDSHREHVKKLDMAAHKTLRRAYEHYRTALRKSSESEKVRARLTATKDVPCADVFELIQKTLSVSHHLYKARLYIEPAIYLQRVLLVALREWIADWARHEKALAALVTQALGPNGIDHGTCGKDCYRNAAAVKGGTAQLAALLTDADLDVYDKQLEDLFGKLAA